MTPSGNIGFDGVALFEAVRKDICGSCYII